MDLTKKEIGMLLCALEFMMENAAPFDDEDRREFQELHDKLWDYRGENGDKGVSFVV